MKGWWLLLLAAAIGIRCSAQAFDLQQLALDIEKLTELRQVLTDLKQGYQVLEAGYTEVRDLSKSSFDLHKAFLDALLAVSPEVRQYRRVKDIVLLETSMISRYGSLLGRLGLGSRLSGPELLLIGQACNGLIDESERALDDLADILTDGVLRASDAERIGAIDRLYTGMAARSAALDRVWADAVLLDGRRLGEADEIGVLRELYGLTQ
jgi:hypothetical protein